MHIQSVVLGLESLYFSTCVLMLLPNHMQWLLVTSVDQEVHCKVSC